MKTTLIRQRDIPDETILELSAQFADFSVAICRYFEGRPDSFRSLGSGTCVEINGRYGVLTAHHCLDACAPPVGSQPNEKIAFCLRRGRPIVVPAEYIVEDQLASPPGNRYGPWGPDLTFIELPIGPPLNTLRACNSFWKIAATPEVIKRRFCFKRAVIVHVGFPERKQKVGFAGKNIDATFYHTAFVGGFKWSGVTRKGGWDFVDSPCDQSFNSKMPPSFEGVSGGGIWSSQLIRRRNGQFALGRFALLGVSFYQKTSNPRKTVIRGHFVNSIYDRAWRK